MEAGHAVKTSRDVLGLVADFAPGTREFMGGREMRRGGRDRRPTMRLS
jgi:hypothetical protein